MATAYANRDASQVQTLTPSGGSPVWLGSLGHVVGLGWSFKIPGGCDQLQCTLERSASFRHQGMETGRIVNVFRGGHRVWQGVMDEPIPTSSGWTLTAVGDGNLGTNYRDVYGAAGTTDNAADWLTPDNGINQAIARGLPWANPGIDGGPYASQYWLGQQLDSASQTLTDLLNLICTRGGLLWYINSQPGGLWGNDLQIFPIPTTPNRMLVSTTPVPRVLGGYINAVFIRYLSDSDHTSTGTVATYSLTSVSNPASALIHNDLEAYIDLSNTATAISQSAAQGVGNLILSRYVRASFAGPFTAAPGQLLNMGGQPIDPGTDQAGTCCQLMLTDYGYGGEVTPQFPISFVVGDYAWDDQAQLATLTPLQSLNLSLSGLISMETTVLTPITVAAK
jgi:hypothetical protein